MFFLVREYLLNNSQIREIRILKIPDFIYPELKVKVTEVLTVVYTLNLLQQTRSITLSKEYHGLAEKRSVVNPTAHM